MRIRSVDRMDGDGPLAAIVTEYLKWVRDGFPGPPELTPPLEEMIAATMSNLDTYLPPRGRLLLLEDGPALIGTSFVKRIRPDMAEVKRLYVRPAARRRRLGARLMDATEGAAREMGCASLVLDTFGWMTAARRLYEARGYREILRYPESENGPGMEPYLVYYRKGL